MAGIIEVKDQGKVRIYDADNSNYIDIVVPSTVSSNRTITIPDATFTIPQETNATHSGEVTGSGALTIADNVVDEANLKVSNAPTNGYFLSAQSGNTGGLTWAAASSEIQQTEIVGSISTGTLDLSTGNVFSDAPAANVTYVFSNPPASGTAYGFTLKVTPSATVTVTWPASVDWAGGTAPTAPASGETDVFTFYTQDGGTTYYGFQAGDAMA